MLDRSFFLAVRFIPDSLLDETAAGLLSERNDHAGRNSKHYSRSDPSDNLLEERQSDRARDFLIGRHQHHHDLIGTAATPLITALHFARVSVARTLRVCSPRLLGSRLLPSRAPARPV